MPSISLATAVATIATLANASSVLLRGGTIIRFDESINSLNVIRNGSLLITDDRITSIWTADQLLPQTSNDTEVIDVANKIITPGFVDTHRHGWQTAFRTIASNTSLAEYFTRYGEFAAAGLLTADDVYIGQLAGLYEALNAGVTTTLDHAHHTWSDETSEAGLKASIDSGARVFWSYAFHNVTNYTISEQLENFRDIATKAEFDGTPTTLGVACDFFGTDGVLADINAVVDLAKEFNVSVITTHSLQGPWGNTNSPEDVHAIGALNTSIPVVFSHASFLTYKGASLLRSTNQYISITPESEMHYGHTHPHSHLIQDQGSLGVDTHFTFSTDILTQARLWLQSTRRLLYQQVLANWRVPTSTPMTVNQAFLLATRSGGLALRRPDLGIITEGAKADVVVWDGESPALLGWVDPVAAVILHASVADVEHVLVNGKFVKKDHKLTVPNYADVKTRFLESARKIQQTWKDIPFSALEGEFSSSEAPYEAPLSVDVLAGGESGYGTTASEMVQYLYQEAGLQAFISAIEEDGCVVIKDFTDQTSLDAAHEEVQPYLNASLAQSGSTIGALNAGSQSTELHRDDKHHHASHIEASHYTKGRDMLLGLFVPECDIFEANGATRIVPGSHPWGDRKPDFLPDGQSGVQNAELKRGEAFVVLGSLYHGAGQYSLETGCRTVHIMFMCSGVPRQEEIPYLSYPIEDVKTYSKLVRDRLGWKRSEPNLGWVDLKSPEYLLK
ncbi:amidohydrolase [Colletotrichum salicis]|uniref:Amidohydrolase n=1 Tax=Colletotrichum salicis TaxID=1209931 RepID=A0A135UUM0_9PEZI|nr:amidohydrolase [Colletotrichum salicis]